MSQINKLCDRFSSEWLRDLAREVLTSIPDAWSNGADGDSPINFVEATSGTSELPSGQWFERSGLEVSFDPSAIQSRKDEVDQDALVGQTSSRLKFFAELRKHLYFAVHGAYPFEAETS